MVRVGELSGSLTKSLEEAVNYLEETDALNKRLRGILIPNILMLVGIIVLLFVGMLVIIPTIQGVFDAMGSKDTLPAITIWFAGVVDKLMKFWYIPIIIIVGIIVGVIAYVTTPRGRYNFDYFKYTMPLFGKLIFSLDFLRLARAMLLNLKNGIRIQDALEVSKNVCKNYVMRSILESSINNIIIGQSWIEPFEKYNLASPMMLEMLNIGMQTDLQEMLEKLIEYMEIDINNTIRKIMKVLPEVVYAIVGIFLIFLVVVVLVPCIQVYMGGWLFSAAGV
jgi:type II secretory pathway component PulF